MLPDENNDPALKKLDQLVRDTTGSSLDDIGEPMTSDTLDTLVRDLTTVHPLPKSEVRARIKAWALSMVGEVRYRPREDWEESLNIVERFPHLTHKDREYILAEIRFQRENAAEEAIAVERSLIHHRINNA